METSTAFGFVPEVELSCDGLTWSHPATSTGVGAVDYYFVAVNDGPVVAYTPGELVQVAWPEDGSQVLVTLRGEYASGFKHQLGQTKRVEPEECAVVVPEPEAEDIELPLPEAPVAGVEVSVPVPVETLPETGVDPLLGLLLAAVALVAGVPVVRRANS